jgi:tetratricopeptide (TPR) repeat protein
VLIESERYEAASHVIQDGFRISRDYPGLNRAVAEIFLRAYDDPQSAISFLRKVLNSPDATEADRRRMGEMLLRAGDVAEARKLYAALTPAEQTGRRGLELLSGIKRALGEVGEADALLRRALTLVPDDVDAQLQLSIMDEAQALEQAKAGAAEAIWRIARRKDEVALKAIGHLAHSSTLTALQAKELLALVDQHAKASERLRYEVIRTYVKLNALERDSVIKAEIARNRGRATDTMFDFLRWLGTEGRYETLLDIIPPESVVRDPDIFLIYVDALTAAERWKELLTLMKSRKPPVTPTTAHVILAQCYARTQPDMMAARRELKEAFELNSRSEVPVLLRAAALAEGLHFADLAVQGYTLISEARPILRLQMMEKVLELQQLDKDVPGMIATARRLHEARPRNQIYADRLNYLRLVSGLELEIAFDEALGFEHEPPASTVSPFIPTALLRAMAAWRFGDMDRVKQEVTSLGDPSTLPAGPRAVVAGLYSVTGRGVESFRIAEKVPVQLLLDAERNFLNLTAARN